MKLVPRLLEAASGILSCLVGGVTMAYLLVVPVYRGTGCVTLPGQPAVCTATYGTPLHGSDGATRAELGAVAVLLLLVAASAVWHALTDKGAAQALLCAATGILFIWAIYPWLAPGAPLLLSIVPAIVACVTSILRASAASA